MRYLPFAVIVLLVPIGLLLALYSPFWGGVISGPALILSLLGLYYILQSKRAVL